MSACSDFAEHVWKPGSCKNCFHPLSAHRKTAGGPGGSAPTPCSRGGQGGDDEAGLTSPSPYSKPTIAVKPTMMSLGNDALTDVNMNIEQENTKSPVERLGLKKLLGLSSLYIDNSCNMAALKSPEHQKDFSKGFPVASLPPNILPKDPVIISNVFVTQEETRGSQSFRKTPSEDAGTRQNTSPARTKGTFNEVGGPRTTSQPSVDIPFSVDIGPSSPAAAHSHDIGVVSASAAAASPTSTNSLTPPQLSSPPLSKHTSYSESSGSYRSSIDSLPGEDRTGGRQVESGSPRGPPHVGGSQSVPGSPNGQLNLEPIYAESTKKKRKAQGKEVQAGPESPNQAKSSAQGSEPEVSETQRATITVMAAHLDENRRTFYLSSPDSAISTRCHFSPPACKDPTSPAFRWPSPSHSSPSLTSDPSLSPPSHPKPQRSPPIPPKRTNRSPKLGTSSLSPSVSSPVPLPELPRLGASSLSTSISSPVPLPELSMLFFVTSRDLKVPAESPGAAVAPERWPKPNNHGPGWRCRIVEEEEEEEREQKEAEKKNRAAGKPATAPPGTGLVNGATVWTEASNCKAHQSCPPPVTEPGTAPPDTRNNGDCQRDAKGNGAAEDREHNGSMPSRQAPPPAAGKGASNHEAHPPPPPPKKLSSRVGGKLSGSSVELDRCGQPGFGGSPLPAPGGLLGSAGLPTTSTDSLAADTSSQDSLRMSPISRSPVVSAPASPNPPYGSGVASQPPPLPEKKTVNRTASAPDANGKSFPHPRLSFTGSEINVCRPGDAGSRASLPSSPVDPRSIFSSNESLEHCHAPLGRPSRSRTLDEPPKIHGRLGVHSRSSLTCVSSPQLSSPFSGVAEAGVAANLGSTLQLQTLLSNIDNREGVYSKLGGLYAESLRRLALKCEEHFNRVRKKPLRFEESSWSLFRLTSNKPSCHAGDAVYYSAACASDPSNSYAVKICKNPCAEARQGHLYGLSVQQSVPPHFNLQQDCGHFLACVPQSMLPSDEAPAANAPAPPAPQAERERVVVITCEVPRWTAADFVREWEAFHKSQPEVYERRVCFLLLQLCNGLEHLKEHGVTHRDLCLENLLLVPHHHRHHHRPSQFAQQSAESGADPQRRLPRLLISNLAKAKRRSSEDAASTAAAGDARVKRDHARLAPEIVSAAQYRKFDEFQTGILIYELLHQANPFEMSPALREQDYRCEELPPIPPVSLYSAGLQRLARLLLQPDPIKRIHIQEAKRVLQSLLWGPRRDLMEQQWERHRREGGFAGGSRHEGLLNWLDVKRALLMMKFAERSLEPERNAELEDWLCCQYFSSAHPLSLCHTAELLYPEK